MADFALKVENLSKRYDLNKSRFSIKNSLLNLISSNQKEESNDFIYALKDVSFELKKGEALGIIGHNGAGKSTLLQILSGVLKPTKGKISINGKITSILDVGMGFHPDLTGEENVYMNGNLLGLKNEEIDALFEKIHEFSGIGKYIYQPVKQYSNGMYLRLAFSVFAHLNTDILILDEVLSVGDSDFQFKCRKRILEMLKQGSSILMVSHSMEEINDICQSCLLLDEGVLKKSGSVNEVTDFYTEFILENNLIEDQREKQGIICEPGLIKWKNEAFQPTNGIVKLMQIELAAKGKEKGETIYMSDDIVIDITYQKITEEGSIEWVLNIFDSNRTRLITDCCGLRKDYKPQKIGLGIFRDRVIIPKNLLNKGLYYISLVAANYYSLSNKNLQPEDFVDINFEIDGILQFRIEHDDWITKDKWNMVINSSLRPILEWKKNAL